TRRTHRSCAPRSSPARRPRPSEGSLPGLAPAAPRIEAAPLLDEAIERREVEALAEVTPLPAAHLARGLQAAYPVLAHDLTRPPRPGTARLVRREPEGLTVVSVLVEAVLDRVEPCAVL